MNRTAYNITRDNTYWRSRARNEGYPEELLHTDNMYSRYLDLLSYSQCLLEDYDPRDYNDCLVRAINTDNYVFLNYLLNNYDPDVYLLLRLVTIAIESQKKRSAKIILDKIGPLQLIDDYISIYELLDNLISENYDDLLISIINKRTDSKILTDVLKLFAIYQPEKITYIRNLYDLDMNTFIAALEELILEHHHGLDWYYDKYESIKRLLASYDWEPGDLNPLAPVVMDLDILKILIPYGFNDITTVYDIAVDERLKIVENWIRKHYPQYVNNQ